MNEKTINRAEKTKSGRRGGSVTAARSQAEAESAPMVTGGGGKALFKKEEFSQGASR